MKTIPALLLSLSTLAVGYSPAFQARTAGKPIDPAAVAKALEYSKNLKGLALIILQDGKTVLEDYHNGYGPDDTHPLTSATKGFAGVILAALVEDGLVSSFDEKAADTITEWAGDPLKSRITLRQLLNMTSGLAPGPTGRFIPYAQALQTAAVGAPGEVYRYGPAPYQVFGEIVKRKLKGETAVTYLVRRIFRPLGISSGGWRMGQDGNPGLSTGAVLKAMEWARYGEFLRNRGRWNGIPIVRADLIEEILKPSAANPVFGLGLWLEAGSNVEAVETGQAPEGAGGGMSAVPKSVYRIIASIGVGTQRLYVIEPGELVVVRQGKNAVFLDAEFLSRLLS